ncbi:ankyrin repeat-containing domain protein [Russula ochroleuca]|uniref:Ankyrin repeat-containing domain protein n=1 Tax=Russula ochroleuca TaxID=152965 RepID=A0A9P5T9N2_9AGAM|nr:ankyrin repeat-containing domain protein [Russula ochroleuca]
MLIERGADVIAQNEDGETPLHLASQEGEVEAVRMLLKHGADINTQNKYGLTPFDLALQGGLEEVTCVLLQHGADPGDPLPSGTVLQTPPPHPIAM